MLKLSWLLQKSGETCTGGRCRLHVEHRGSELELKNAKPAGFPIGASRVVLDQVIGLHARNTISHLLLDPIRKQVSSQYCDRKHSPEENSTAPEMRVDWHLSERIRR